MDGETLSRARSIEELRQRMGRLRTPEGVRYGLSFTPRPDDVIIDTYPKSGTTWMQQIVHGLRTGGDMAFSEISDPVPWIEMAYDLGQDLTAEQKANPRAFKCHLPWDDVPKGCRYIVVVRDPKKVAVSFYHFLEGWYFEPGAIAFEPFVRDFVAPGARGRDYWGHLLSWWPQRDSERTLFLAYEDMQDDLAGAVARVAKFIGIDAGPPLLELATRQAGLAFMQAHATQFDDHLIRDARNAVCGLPPGGASAKVSPAGQPRQKFTPALDQYFDDIWAREIAPVLGFPDYPALRAALGAI